mgnify:CR=1 FL=1
MNKVVSFCLYGNSRKYTHGIIEAVVSYKLFFIGWEIWIYVSEKTVPLKTIEVLKNFNCKIIMMCETGTLVEEKGIGLNENNEPMFWRFTPLYDDSVDYWLTRDADSRASKREKEFVDTFISSSKAIHSILDQRCHHGLMGGTSGFNNKELKKYNIEHFSKYIEAKVKINNRTRRGSDQTWLREAFKAPILDKNIYLHVCKGWFNENKTIPTAVFLYDIKVSELSHEITDNESNFIGRQINIDETEHSRKVRNQILLPFAV